MNGSGSSSSCCPDPSKRKREVVLSCTDAATDLISQLPRPILHHILSFLETKDVIRTGILSKTWHHTSTSFPISYFSQDDWRGTRRRREEPIHIFVDFVRRSLQRQRQIYEIIPKFKLSMFHRYSRYGCMQPHILSSVEDCIQMAVQNHVKELDIKIVGTQAGGSARLFMPQTLLSANELILLSLYGCNLSSPPTHDVPTWASLSKLHLQHCHIEGLNFQNLTSSCPLLESLFLLYCDELPDIRLSCLTKLTEVHIARKLADTHDIMVELDVQCLKTFSLYTKGGRCNVNLTACKNITVLKWSHFPPMLSSVLAKLIAGLPALESLELFRGSVAAYRPENLEVRADQLLETDLCDLVAGLPALKSLSLNCMCERIKFSSQRLEKLKLSANELMENDLTDLIAGLPSLKFLSLACKLERIKFSSQQLEVLHLSVCELVEVRIDAPNLKTFESSVLPSDSFMGRSSPEEVTVGFFYDSPSSFLELRKFLGAFKQIKLLKIFLHQYSELPILLPAALMDIPLTALVPDIKRLIVFPRCGVRALGKGVCVAILNGLLWSCRPGSMSIQLNSYGKIMSEVFCEELPKMIKGEHCCTEDDPFKCGCNGLRNFQIKQPDGEFADQRSNEGIRFMFEW